MVCWFSIFICLNLFCNLSFDLFFDPLMVQWHVVYNHIFINFPVFLLQLVSSIIQLWPENMLYIILILNSLWLVIWSNIWSIMDNILCAFEKNVYYISFVRNVLYMSVKISGLKGLLNANGPFDFLYEWRSIDEIGV